MQKIIESLNWRYATKKYDSSKKVSKENLETILESARLSATSYGLQPFRMLVIEDPKVRAKLSEPAYGQPQITDASNLVVFAIRKDIDAKYIENFVKTVAETRGIPVESLAGYSDMMKGSLLGLTPEQRDAWSAKQAYIALGTALLTAADLKIDATPMEGFDPAKVDEVLGLKEKNLGSVVILALGYRSTEDATANYKKVRFSKEEMIQTI